MAICALLAGFCLGGIWQRCSRLAPDLVCGSRAVLGVLGDELVPYGRLTSSELWQGAWLWLCFSFFEFLVCPCFLPSFLPCRERIQRRVPTGKSASVRRGERADRALQEGPENVGRR